MDSQRFQNYLTELRAGHHDADTLTFIIQTMNDDPDKMTVLQYMIRLGPFWNREEKKLASNSALRRWIEQGAVILNGRKPSPNEILDEDVFSLVMFPKSDKQRITLA